MSTSFGRSRVRFTPPLLESLEARQFLSLTSSSAMGGVLLAVPRSAITASSIVLSGTTIHAEANQAFRAVIGTIHGLAALPSGYTLQGMINWGDGTPRASATFVHQADGSIAVLGAHTYAAVGADKITITVVAVPPAGTLLPVRLIGTIHSTATVIAPDGGVTLNETAGVSFTANIGTFRSTLPASTMTAVITWGDGTQSLGKIVALPSAAPLAAGAFAVFADHAYGNTGSYLVHVTVYSSLPSPIVGPTATTPPVILVAQIDTVIDVLPPLPTATP